MTATVVVQARMASTRLPGKVLRPLGGRPVLEWVVRAARAAAVGDVVVATSTVPTDDGVARWAAGAGVDLVRGPEDDVLSRFLLAIEGLPASRTVVRLTADCPLHDPALIRQAVAAFESGEADYLSNVLDGTLPRGFDVEVTTAAMLREIDGEATGFDRVHVTSLLYRTGGRRLAGLVYRPAAADLRVTLDTPEDAALLDAVVGELGDRPPSWRDVVALLRRRPDLVALNRGVRPKEIDEG